VERRLAVGHDLLVEVEVHHQKIPSLLSK